MAVIEHTSIKRSPLGLLKYITGETKAEKSKLITGLNCSEDATSAYLEMNLCFESITGKSFSEVKSTGRGKQKIKMHHYIQSFKKGEVTPEKAHKIAVEWAERVFGKNHQVLIATHEDTEHIHTHFAVNAYDLKGKHWIDNKTTLKRCRDISDDIAKKYKLSVIEKPKNKRNRSYASWLASKNNESWQDLLRADIDRIIMLDSVKTVDDLLGELMQCGYIIKKHKYISIKPADIAVKKPMRSYRLGDGYGLEELQYRIENKDREMSLEKVLQYEGVQKDYAMCLRQLQITLYRKSELHLTTYTEVRKSADLLCYLSDNNIRSKEEFAKHVDIIAKEADEIAERYNKLKEKISDFEYMLEHRERYLELNNKEYAVIKEQKEIFAFHDIAKKYKYYDEEDLENIAPELEKAKKELAGLQKGYDTSQERKKTAGRNYKTLLNNLETDYERYYNAAKKEVEEFEQAKREAEEAKRKAETPSYDFIDTIQNMSDWADEVQKKAAREHKQEEQQYQSYSYYEDR